jgi:hypothetical protein
VDTAQEGSGLSEASNDDRAYRAFERGDFAEARKLAAEMKSSPDPAARSAADLILGRTSLDPLIVAITALCLIGFSLIAIFSR